MVPAMTALAATPAAPVRRLGLIYVPKGAVMENWIPATDDAWLRDVADPEAA